MFASFSTKRLNNASLIGLFYAILFRNGFQYFSGILTTLKKTRVYKIMSEQLKYIVEELNKEPFKRNYNLIRHV